MTDSPSASLPARVDPWLRWMPWVLALLFLLPNYAFFHDNLVYANQVSFRPWSVKVHPHHIGYNTLIWIAWTLTAQAMSPLFWMVILGRLAGIASLFTVRRLASTLGLTVVGQRWLLGIYGMSFGIWFHATSGAAYVPAVWCVLEALTTVMSWPSTGPDRRSFHTATIWFLAAICLHQLAVLALIPALAWLWLNADERRPAMSRLTSAWIGSAVGLYAIAFAISQQSINPIEGWFWATRYGHSGDWWWWEGVSNLGTGFNAWLATQVGTTLRVLWGTPFGQHLDPVTTEPLAMAWQVAWPKERYFGLAQLLVLPLLLGWGWIAAQWWRTHVEQRRLAIWLALWIIPFWFLTLLFDPGNAGFRLYYLIPTIALFLLPLTTDPPRPIVLASLALGPLWLAFTLATNYAYGWNPLSRVLINPRYDDLMHAEELPRHAILVGGPEDPDWLDQQYLMQFQLGTGQRPVFQTEWVEASVAESTSEFATKRTPPPTILVSQWLFDRYMATPFAERLEYLHAIPVDPSQDEYWIPLSSYQPTTGYDLGHYQFVELQHFKQGSPASNASS